MDNNSISINTIINGLMALGTLLAIIVALFQERIKLWRFIGPNLIIETVDYPTRFQGSFASGNLYCRYLFFLKVVNEGFTTSKNTKCEIKQVYSAESEAQLLRDYYAPQYLPWYFKTSENTYKLDLSPGEEKLISLVFRDELNPKAMYLAEDISKETSLRPINTTGHNQETYKDEVEIEIVLYCDNSMKKSYLCKVSIATNAFGSGFQIELT